MNYYDSRLMRIRKIGPKIDLGCGKKCPPGFVGIDMYEFGQDIRWDVRNGIPFPDNSVTHLVSTHFIEHITDQEMMCLWGEILRVCIIGAVLDFRCPHSGTQESYYHNHLSYWNEQKVHGVVAGFHGSASVGGKYFSRVKVERAGIELVFSLIVKKKV